MCSVLDKILLYSWILVLVVDVPGPFDHGLWGAIEEDQLRVKFLF